MMPFNLNRLFIAILLIVLLASCATSDPSDDFSFDYSSAKPSDFNGFWQGRVDCKYANGFKPYTWVRIKGGRGEFGFGNGSPGLGHDLLGSLYADFDSQTGKINWRGELLPWRNTKDKMPVSFRGQWRGKEFKLDGKLGKKRCSGVQIKT